MRRSVPGWSVIAWSSSQTRRVASVEPLTLEITTVVAGGDGLGRDAERTGHVRGRRPAGRDGRGGAAPAEEGLRPRARCWRSLRPVARPGRAAVPVRRRRVRGLRLAARAARRPAPAQGRRRRRRAAAPGHGSRSSVDEGPVLAAEAYRTTLRGVATDGRFGLPASAQPRVVDVGPVPGRPPAARRAGRPTVASPTARWCSAPAPRTGERLVDRQRRRRRRPQVPEGVRVVSAAELVVGHPGLVPRGGGRAPLADLGPLVLPGSARRRRGARRRGGGRRWTAPCPPAGTWSTSTAASACSPARWAATPRSRSWSSRPRRSPTPG